MNFPDAFEYTQLKKKIDSNTATAEERRVFLTLEAILQNRNKDQAPFKEFVDAQMKRL